MTTPQDADSLLNVAPAFKHPQHFSDLDGLRGLLALSVVLYHYGINAIIQRMTAGRFAGFIFDLSVDFFFLLSGYVLAYSMRKGTPGFYAFAIKRAVRLLPVYYVTLGLMLAMVPWASPTLPFLTHIPSAQAMVSDLLVFAPIIGITPLNVPSWSVTYEMFLPIIAVLLAVKIGKNIRYYSVPLLILAGLCLSYTSYLVAANGHYYGYRAFLGLSGGCALYLAMPRLTFPAILFTSAAMYALIASMLIVTFLSGWVPLFAICFPWIAILTIVVGTRTRTALSSRPLSALGHLSYTLYMVHIPVFVASSLIFGNISGSLLAKTCTLIVAIAAAGLLTFVVERPAMALGHSLARRREKAVKDCS